MAVSKKAQEFCKNPLYVVNNLKNIHAQKVGRPLCITVRGKVGHYIEFMDGGIYKVVPSMELQPFDKGYVVGSRGSKLFGLATIHQYPMFGCRVEVFCGKYRNSIMSVNSLISVGESK